MSSELAILKDLLAGQTTADSLAPRVKLSTTAATSILVTLKRQGFVDSSPLANMPHLHIYRITFEGKVSLNPTK